MKGKILFKQFLTLLLLIAFSILGTAENRIPADLILKNGFIHTVDPFQPKASALAVREGRLVFVGDDRDVDKYIGPKTRIVDLKGRLVLPGFIDSHAHPVSAYKHFYEILLNNEESLDGYLRAITDFVHANPNPSFIRGRGWKNTFFGKTGPDRRRLDALVGDIPVALASEDGHSRWVNSRVLEMAEITAETPDPAGGIIERDPQTGEPTGTLRESAVDLIVPIFPPYSVEELKKGLLAYQDMALSFGITTVHDASLDAGSNDTAAYRSLEREHRLRMRFRASLYADPAKGLAQITSLVEERRCNNSDHFRTSSVKLFMDGVVEGSSAFLKESYLHLPGFRSQLLWEPQSLARFCVEVDRLGFQIHVHSIGDAATSAMLDALAFVRQENGTRDSRHSITHLQLVDGCDIPRFFELGVVAVPQAYWFKKDTYYFNMQLPYLGRKREEKEYPMNSFFKAGVIVASASDYPVTIPCNPLIAIETGISRCEPGEAKTGSPLWLEEGTSLERMIESFTINGAIANFLEQETGSLRVGKKADLIVLDRNLFNIPVNEIHGAKVLLTFFEGQVVFGDPDSFGR